jgi:uncharacterized membrane protein
MFSGIFCSCRELYPPEPLQLMKMIQAYEERIISSSYKSTVCLVVGIASLAALIFSSIGSHYSRRKSQEDHTSKKWKFIKYSFYGFTGISLLSVAGGFFGRLIYQQIAASSEIHRQFATYLLRGCAPDFF